MDEALKEAKIAFDLNEVPVGAIIVDSKTGKIIARSHNKNITQKDSTSHAEILAIKEACKIKESHRLDDCDLYVTLEPCAMCAGAISLARIRRLYFGAEDKKSGGTVNGAQIFESKSTHHKPEIYGEINDQECSGLLKKFFQSKR
jgi:tRNA(adenine34) deaminase